MTDCIFCKIIERKIPANIVYETDKVIAFLDIMPVNSGHVLVVPKSHQLDMLETPDILLSALIVDIKKIAKGVMSAVNADGFNLGVNTKPAAGQVVFHTHFHIIPRFSNDGLKHWPHKKMEQKEMAAIADQIKKKLN